jgi:hypothetical protein
VLALWREGATGRGYARVRRFHRGADTPFAGLVPHPASDYFDSTHVDDRVPLDSALGGAAAAAAAAAVRGAAARGVVFDHVADALVPAPPPPAAG